MTIKFESDNGKNCNDQPLSKISTIFAEMYLTDCDVEYLFKEFAKKLGYEITKKCFQGYCYAVGCKNERIRDSKYCEEHNRRESEFREELRQGCKEYNNIEKNVKSELAKDIGLCFRNGCFEKRFDSRAYCKEHYQEDLAKERERINKSESEHKLELRLDKLDNRISRFDSFINFDWYPYIKKLNDLSKEYDENNRINTQAFEYLKQELNKLQKRVKEFETDYVIQINRLKRRRR